MNDSHRLLLLKVIKFDGNLQPLVNLGYEFADVGTAIKKEVSLGTATFEKGKIKITEKGEAELVGLEAIAGRKFPWIEPEIESRIEPLKKDEIYIPSRESIRFLFK